MLCAFLYIVSSVVKESEADASVDSVVGVTAAAGVDHSCWGLLLLLELLLALVVFLRLLILLFVLIKDRCCWGLELLLSLVVVVLIVIIVVECFETLMLIVGNFNRFLSSVKHPVEVVLGPSSLYGGRMRSEIL